MLEEVKGTKTREMKAVISYQLSGTRWEFKRQSTLTLIQVLDSDYHVKNWLAEILHPPGMPAFALRANASRSWGKPRQVHPQGNPNAQRESQSPLSGDPHNDHAQCTACIVLVSPDPSVGKPSSRTGSQRENQSPLSGKPSFALSSPQRTASPRPRWLTILNKRRGASARKRVSRLKASGVGHCLPTLK
jgi:hypothetical protein